MGIRETGTQIRDCLKNNSQAIGCRENLIRFGKGIPTEAPFVEIYPRPVPGSDLPRHQICEFYILAGIAGGEESVFDALEMAERCMVALINSRQFDFKSIQYGYDQEYDDISVAYVVLECQYSIDSL